MSFYNNLSKNLCCYLFANFKIFYNSIELMIHNFKIQRMAQSAEKSRAETKETVTKKMSKGYSSSQKEMWITESPDGENIRNLSYTKPIRVVNTREIKN